MSSSFESVTPPFVEEKLRANVFCFSCLSAIHSNHPQTGVITLLVPTYSPTTLSVGFTGLALCAYTECCGLGGWVGLLGLVLCDASAICERYALFWSTCKTPKTFALFWYFRFPISVCEIHSFD